MLVGAFWSLFDRLRDLLATAIRHIPEHLFVDMTQACGQGAEYGI